MLETVSFAQAARECGVSVSVLHRWRKKFGNHRAAGDADAWHVDAKLPLRRGFSKEFKESVVKRLEAGESVRDAVRASCIDPTVLRRWRDEWREYGEAAFSGYGKSRSPAPASRTVVIRFTSGEYEAIQAVSRERRARSLPDFVRAQILAGGEGPSVGEIEKRLEALTTSVKQATLIASRGGGLAADDSLRPTPRFTETVKMVQNG